MSEGRAQRLPRRVFTFFVDHWLIAGLIPPLPGLVSLGLRLFDVQMSLPMAVAGSVVILVASVFSLAKAKAVKYEIGVRNNNDFVLARLLKATNAVTRNKLELFSAFLRDRTCPLPAHPFEEITQPETQLRCVLEHLQRALVEIHGLDSDQVGVSLACKRNDKWCWLVRTNCEDDLEFSVLTTNTASAFHHVMIAKTQPFLFCADKRVGVKGGRYVPSARDGEVPIGSILVHRLDLPIDGDIFSVALSINTYGKQLCEERDHEAKEKIRTTLLPCFELRLRLELCLYYIKQVMVPRSPSLLPMAPASRAPEPTLPHLA
jgi:hypothetical protein